MLNWKGSNKWWSHISFVEPRIIHKNAVYIEHKKGLILRVYFFRFHSYYCILHWNKRGTAAVWAISYHSNVITSMLQAAHVHFTRVKWLVDSSWIQLNRRFEFEGSVNSAQHSLHKTFQTIRTPHPLAFPLSLTSSRAGPRLAQSEGARLGKSDSNTERNKSCHAHGTHEVLHTCRITIV